MPRRSNSGSARRSRPTRRARVHRSDAPRCSRERARSASAQAHPYAGLANAATIPSCVADGPPTQRRVPRRKAVRPRRPRSAGDMAAVIWAAPKCLPSIGREVQWVSVTAPTLRRALNSRPRDGSRDAKSMSSRPADHRILDTDRGSDEAIAGAVEGLPPYLRDERFLDRESEEGGRRVAANPEGKTPVSDGNAAMGDGA